MTIATLANPEGAILRTFRIQPGETHRIVLEECALRIELVDLDLDGPVSGGRLEAWCPQTEASMAEAFPISPEGAVTVPVSSLPVLLRLEGYEWTSELVALSGGVAGPGGSGSEAVVRIEAFGCEEVVVLGVRKCPGRLMLIDSVSGEGIEGEAQVTVRQISSEGRAILSTRSSFGSTRGPFPVRAGLFELPCNPLFTEVIPPGEPDTEMVLSVTGYAPTVVPEHRSLFLEGAPPATVSLRPVPERWIEVVRKEGRPFVRGITIFGPHENVYCYQSHGNAEGLYGPFDWLGTDVTVSTGEGDWTISAAELASSEVVQLAVPRRTGAIRVVDIPEGAVTAALVAKLGQFIEGPRYSPSEIDSAGVLFEGLPRGSYLVGPSVWVKSAEKNLYRSKDPVFAIENTLPPARVTVKAGETTTVSWMRNWSANSPLEGTVTLSGPSSVQPFLAALHSNASPAGLDPMGKPSHLLFGNRAPRIPMDASGHYRIEAQDPLPVLIAVCRRHETTWGEVGGMHVLEVIRPGESADIKTASIVLTWKGASQSRAADVRYSVPLDKMRYVTSMMMNVGKARWSTKGTLRLEAVPITVDRILIDRRVLEVDLRAGGEFQFEVDLAMLPFEQR